MRAVRRCQRKRAAAASSPLSDRGGPRLVQVAARIVSNLGRLISRPRRPVQSVHARQPHVQRGRALRAFLPHVAHAAPYGV
jgi:hypothetical protein